MIRILTHLSIKSCQCRLTSRRSLIIFLFLIGTGVAGWGQPGTSFKPPAIRYNMVDTTAGYGEPEDDYEEISVTLNVPRIGSLEIPAVVYGQKIYLSIRDVFDFLKIRNIVSPDFDLVQGFFIYPKDNYSIDKTNNRIVYQYKSYDLPAGDLIRTETALYLKSDYFGQIFGLDCSFDFRSLSVTLRTKIELPAIREMQQELMRRNLGQLKGEKKADSMIGRTFPLFHVGMADWAVTATQETKGRDNTRASLAIGAVAAGGELNLALNYNSDNGLNPREQFYQWRLVNNDHAGLRQVIAGKIFPQSIASIYAPVVGIQFTNTPTTYRRSFGSYTVSNTTEPGWMVELYINNVLVNYTKADASGFYSFEVPMVYGNSVVKLRFYGPWGEERTSEKYISVPFNFIPLHQFEYNVTAGVVEDGPRSRYARAAFNYGLSRRITIGGGTEYLSSVTSGRNLPFINTAVRLGPHLLISAEHTYGVRSKGAISYRLPSNLQLDLTYTRYNKGQTAILFNYLDEKKMIFSLPFRGKGFTAFSRFTLNQFTLPYNLSPKTKNKYTSAEFLLSSVVSGVSSNLTTYAVLSNPGNPLVYSNLSLTLRLPAGFWLKPQVQYEYRQKAFSKVKAEVEKSLFNRGFLNVAYEKAFISNPVNSVTVGLRYNFSFAQTFFSASTSRHIVATTQSARGSLLYDGKTNYLGVSTQSSVGRGGIIILPYLDLNCNGRRDAGEPKAFGLRLHINGGRMEQNLRDTTIRITGLEAYTNCYVELDKNSFDNVAWQIRKPTLSVAVDPNLLKLIEVAVAVVGEASGKVSLSSSKGTTALGRVIVNIYNRNAVLVAHLLTEADGSFDFVGLAPGDYTASVDAAQLAKIGMKPSAPLAFKILQNKDGDMVNNLEFVLQPAAESNNPVPEKK